MIEIILVVSLALIFGSILIFLDQFLGKKEEEVEKILEQLPGYNCGACGYGSCEGMARAILKEKEVYEKCRPMKKEAKEKLKDYLKNK